MRRRGPGPNSPHRWEEASDRSGSSSPGSGAYSVLAIIEGWTPTSTPPATGSKHVWRRRPAATGTEPKRTWWVTLPGIVAAYPYGSTARGTRHRESDIDIGVLLDRETYPDRRQRVELRVRLASDLIAALGMTEVDVVVLNDVPPGLAVRIVLDGTLLVVADPEGAHAFSRDAQLRRADLAPFLRRNSRLKREALAR